MGRVVDGDMIRVPSERNNPAWGLFFEACYPRALEFAEQLQSSYEASDIVSDAIKRLADDFGGVRFALLDELMQ